MHCWAAQLRRSQVAAAVVLRQTAGLEIAEVDGFVWIRGGELDERTAQQLRCLPVEETYDLWPDGQLVIRGQRVPTSRLPGANWTAIRSWFELELPRLDWPGGLSDRIPLRLVPSSEVNEASVLLTSVAEWLAFGTEAPEIRLEHLRFAACEDGRVLIEGHPLPALRGTRFVCSQGVAVPAGWRWEPAVDAGILADVLQLAEDDVALLAVGRNKSSQFRQELDIGEVPELRKALVRPTIEIVGREQFVRASRSSIRATAEAVTSG